MIQTNTGKETHLELRGVGIGVVDTPTVIVNTVAIRALEIKLDIVDNLLTGLVLEERLDSKDGHAPEFVPLAVDLVLGLREYMSNNVTSSTVTYQLHDNKHHSVVRGIVHR